MALPACYLSHGTEPVERTDGAVPTDAPSPRDVRPDAGPPAPDAGPSPPCAFEVQASAFVTDTPFASHAPELGWDGEQVGLVVFESDGSIGHPVVSFTRIRPDLSAFDPLAIVGEESHAWGEAAWDARRGFAVCWSGDPGGTTRTLLRLRDRAGGATSPLIEVDPMGGACEGMARARDRWAAVYRHGHPDVGMRVSVFDDRGNPVGTPLELDSPIPYPGRSALLTADGEDFLAAVPFEGVGMVIHRIARDGSIPLVTTIDAPRARYGAIAVHDDGTVGLVIRDGTRERGGLRLLRLDRDLNPLPGETLLVVEGRGVRHPRLLPVPDGWAVLWVEQPEASAPTAAVLAHLDHDGVPLEPRRVMVAGPNSGYGGPSLLYAEGALYAAIAQPDADGGHEQVEISRLTCEAPAPDRCDAQDARSSGFACATLTGFSWNGTTCEPVLCGCVGTECARIAPLEEECLADHRGC